MATQPLEPSLVSIDTEKLEAILPKPLRKQIARHVASLRFGRVTLCIEKGRIRFIERTESEAAAS